MPQRTPLLLLSALLVFHLRAQAPPAAPVLPKKLAAVVDLARSVPAEFAADALLRLVESEAVTEVRGRRELIEEAFRLAGTAQEPMKRRGIRQGAPDTHANFRARAFGQDLDALSLESRAVTDMLRIDPAQARELFEQIAPPHVPQLTCADPLVYDVSAYYDALPGIVGNGFTAKERAQEQPVKYLAGVAGRISSPVEIGPAARALAAVKMTPAQLQTVLNSFAAALRTIHGDDRAFSFTISREANTFADFEALAAAAGRQQVSTVALVDAFRAYLVRHLTATRCWDTGGPTITTSIVGSGPPQPADPVGFFNDRLRAMVYPPESQVPPLGDNDVRAAGVEGKLEEEKGWDNEQLKLITDRYNGLLRKPDGAFLSGDEKNSSEWKNKLLEFLAAMAEWRAEEGASADGYFYRKCYLFSSIFNVVPNGPLREQVLRGYLHFLEQNSYQQASRLEWFLPVNTLLVRVMVDPALAALAEEMRQSHDAVIALYARLDAVAPRSPGKVVALM